MYLNNSLILIRSLLSMFFNCFFFPFSFYCRFSKSECSSSQVYSREASNVSIFKTKWTLQLAVAAASESDSAIIYSKFSADPVIDKLSRIPLCYYVSFLHRFNYFYRTNQLWRGEWGWPIPTATAPTSSGQQSRLRVLKKSSKRGCKANSRNIVRYKSIHTYQGCR